MNEMKQLRALRSHAPQPDPHRLAAGRQELLRTTRGRATARRWPARWQLTAAASAAAITAVTLVGGQLRSSGDPEFVPVARPAYTSQLGGAKQVLNQAADAIARGAAPRVEQDDWVYVRGTAANATDQEQPGLRQRESWTRFADPSLEKGRAGDDHSPRETYDFLAALPRDPNEAKRKARAFLPGDGSESTTQHDFRVLQILVRAYPAPPQGLATVYRALATVPGVEAARAVDVLKRDAIAVYLPGSEQAGSLREEVLLDPQTYLYSGSRWIAQKDNQDPDASAGDRWRKGDVIIDESRGAVSLVDEENERP
ncbi:CU044_5270 family protein [Streptomyces sp. CB02009]|uniref:CU044_5270 family protein n=1 Tax=Streptomyces sp. CB02009 TaxID=1703938 RepID=UPI000AD8CDE9|nr:CU044_5270 family protein [Streptomyces sp. CB02009]